MDYLSLFSLFLPFDILLTFVRWRSVREVVNIVEDPNSWFIHVSDNSVIGKITFLRSKN